MEIRQLLDNGSKAAKAMASRSIEFQMDRIPFRARKVPLKKMLNWLVSETSVHLKPGRPWGMPTMAKIEVSSLCNLKCAFCPVTTGLNRPQGLMEWDLYKKFIDQAGPYLLLVILWEWGEPLVNPRLPQMIAYAKKAGIKTVTSTNGMLLTNDGMARRLVQSGLDSLIVAVDGLDEKTQTQYRKRSKLSQIIEGIKAVVRARQELKTQTPLLNFRMVVNRHNESQVDDAEALARELGVDMISFKTMNAYDTVDNGLDHLGTSFIPQNPDHARYVLDGDTGHRKKVENNRCRSLWNCPDIHWNGIIVPCCFDQHDDTILGDLRTQDFRDIWRGAPYAAMRTQFRRDWGGHSLCKNCSYAYEGGTLCEEAVRDARFFLPGLTA